ncbi:MAG: 2'-5' RNA ligase family protein [Candidatus Sulfopaludibacter sp.]|nr:2'-5' RNA ligase family protein [Candidatus Sulfopaludibacter sp.]
MGCTENGVPGRPPLDERLNVFALVVYIPGALGDFLDELRRELVPHYNPHAHVSVLPPRPLAVAWETASGQARALSESWLPFDVHLTDIQVFPVTKVIYIEIGGGASELYRMHTAMNLTDLAFQEPFPYHPHVTLAQEIPHEGVTEVQDMAERRWREYQGPRVFRAERAVFVQNTVGNCWLDLAEYSLGAVSVR